MNVVLLHRQILRPALALASQVTGRNLGGPAAERLLLAIALQESDARHRRQLGGGPARGYWQFERGGGVRGVLRHASTRELVRQLCAAIDIEPTEDVVWTALPWSELLQVAFARLLLWTDARPLPGPGEQDAGWAYYLRNWRPGKPHPTAWPVCWAMASQHVGDAGAVTRRSQEAAPAVAPATLAPEPETPGGPAAVPAAHAETLAPAPAASPRSLSFEH